MKISFYTLGCKANQFETAALERLCVERGHEAVPFSHRADACIINTCSVTEESDRKSKSVIRRARVASPGSIVAVCGCYSQMSPREAEKLADIVCGTADRAAVIGLIEQYQKDRQKKTAVTPAGLTSRFEMLPAGGLSGRTRAYLKVEDGCNRFCAYCIIPHARGPVRSMPIGAAADESARLAEKGFMEIVVTGIEISSYGIDLHTGETLADLIGSVCSAAPRTRIRLGSLDPVTITPDFLSRVAPHKNLCPHFHLSLQSGCDETLKRMGRSYDTGRFYQSVLLLRQYFDNPGITADLIVGFPGESDADFQKTLGFLKKCAFSRVHVFKYSERPGTPAATLSASVPKPVRKERAKAAADVAGELGAQYRRSCLGAVLFVLFEHSKGGYAFGHAENYCEVRVKTDTDLQNRVLPVLICGVSGEVLEGRPG